MTKAFKLPKRVAGVKLPKPMRKVANRLLTRLDSKELEALAGVVAVAVISHLADRKGEETLGKRGAKAVGGHLIK